MGDAAVFVGANLGTLRQQPPIVPSFCRHNRLVHTCPICAREQSLELRPIISSATPKAGSSPKTRPSGGHGHPGAARAGAAHGNAGHGAGAAGRRSSTAATRHGAARHSNTGIRVRHLARDADDGYRSPLVPGLKSSTDAERLAQEIAFAADRLRRLETDPPELLAEIAASSIDLEERTWLAFLIAYLGPLEDERPFAVIESVRTSWTSPELPDLDGVETGPRSVHEDERGDGTIDAYRAWAQRAGSQEAAFTGEPTWTPERRFARAFERLALPGMQRDARFDLLCLLGRLGCYDMRAGALALVGENDATLAAKRALGIGDTMLLERRAAELAQACEVPLEALDLALHNWETGVRLGVGVPADTPPQPQTLSLARTALGVD